MLPTMNVLGMDVGSSSIKAGILRKGRLQGRAVRAAFATHYDGDRAEVSADAVLRALAHAVDQLGERARKVDVIAMSVMAASWIAMDHGGRAITPIVTHQDRRSVDAANALVAKVGKRRILSITGNMPIPGGISSTTWRWFLDHEPRLMRKADLVGHLQTFLHRQLNGARVVDPSHASFMGIYQTLTQRGWSEELCDAVGASEHQLPQLIEAEGVAGMVTRSAGERFGLTHGTPMLVGCIDTSAAMLLAGTRPGQMLDVSGSTDVLALCTDKPTPHENLLTRALGMGRCWLSVSTIAAAGSSLSWAKDQLYADLSVKEFFKLVDELAPIAAEESGDVTFEPYLAGSRTSVEQRRAAFAGLTLSTTRRQMLAAVIEALASASSARLKLMKQVNGVRIRNEVLLSGGAQASLARVLRRDWPERFTFRCEEEATLRGLAVLAEG
jgi:sugar (pentulose or hexulose) kinase